MKKNIRFLSVIVAAVTFFGTIFGVINAKPLTTYAAGEGVDSYSSLAASYDDFIYVATEFYEYGADGSLTATDYRVDPGQMLQMRVYIKSDRYLGTGKLGLNFDNTFFDLKNGEAEELAGIEHIVPLRDGTIGVNYSNPCMDSAGIIFTKTTSQAQDLPVIKNNLLTIENKTAVFNAGGANQSSQTLKLGETSVEFFSFLKNGVTGLNVWECNSDEWCFATDITVKDGLSDGSTGWTVLDERYYSVYDLTQPLDKGTRPFDIKSDISAETKAAYCKGLVYRQGSEYFVNVKPENFVTSDCNHVFVIGNSVEIPDDTEEYIPPVTDKPEIPTDPEIPTEPGTDPVLPPETEDGEIKFAIKTPSVTEIKYGDSIYLHSQAEGIVPENTRVLWYCNNTCFTPNNAEGSSVLLAPQDNGTATITAVLLSEDGDVLGSDKITLTSKANIIYKIIGFFKQLFGLTEIYDATV